MQQIDLAHLTWLRLIVATGNFTRAAAQAGVAQSTLSHGISQLEERLGTRLLTRTTRHVALTETGARFLTSITPHLEGLETEIATTRQLRDQPSGSFRLTLSQHAYETVVGPKLCAFLKTQPGIRLEFSIDDGFRNLVTDRFDAGIRLGESVEKDMIAVRIGPDWRMIAVASPSYLAHHGAPNHPHDLLRHDCINMRQQYSGGLYGWEFERNKKSITLRVDGQLTFNSSYPMIEAAAEGLGIAYVPESVALRALSNGTLVQVLDEWCPFFDGYFLYYPSRRQQIPAFRLLVEALREKRP